jgi:proline iminopeptidase
MRDFYPEIEAYDSFMLDVTGGHQLSVELSGNPEGKPVIFLHGGPGGGTNPTQRRVFDPDVYRIVLFDQRGCGGSGPHASVEQNTTWDLVADIERIREHLGIDRWQVFGGSWGSTLGLAYAQSHPDRVTELILRGIFLARRSEVRWLYQEGASLIFPDDWERYLEPVPVEERDDLLAAYHARLFGEDPEAQIEAARAWSNWEFAISHLIPDVEGMSDEECLALARIENHYFINGAFFERDSQLLENIDRIRHLPGVIVQGRYDIVCPMVSAWDLHKAWPEAEFAIVPNAGHAMTEPGTRAALLEATDWFRSTRSN